MWFSCAKRRPESGWRWHITDAHQATGLFTSSLGQIMGATVLDQAVRNSEGATMRLVLEINRHV